MTDQEFDIFVVALKYKKKYSDCNSEVGMGPSMLSLLESVANESGVALSESEEDRAIQFLKRNVNV